MSEYDELLDFDAPRRGGRAYQDQTARLAKVNVQDAAAAEKEPTTDLSDNRKKHNITPYKEWVARIDTIAAEMGISKMDAWNAILFLGFQSYDEGNRPSTRPRDRARNKLAVMD